MTTWSPNDPLALFCGITMKLWKELLSHKPTCKAFSEFVVSRMMDRPTSLEDGLWQLRLARERLR
jgi:hypothetical protein